MDDWFARGTIVDERGAALHGAVVAYYSSSDAPAGCQSSVETDQHGDFELCAPRTGRADARLKLRISIAGDTTGKNRIGVWSFLRGIHLTVTLPSAEWFAYGKLVDKKKNAVPNVSISYYPPEEWPADCEKRPAVSDDQGKFRICAPRVENSEAPLRLEFRYEGKSESGTWNFQRFVEKVITLDLTAPPPAPPPPAPPPHARNGARILMDVGGVVVAALGSVYLFSQLDDRCPGEECTSAKERKEYTVLWWSSYGALLGASSFGVDLLAALFLPRATRAPSIDRGHARASFPAGLGHATLAGHF